MRSLCHLIFVRLAQVENFTILKHVQTLDVKLIMGLICFDLMRMHDPGTTFINETLSSVHVCIEDTRDALIGARISWRA